MLEVLPIPSNARNKLEQSADGEAMSTLLNRHAMDTRTDTPRKFHCHPCLGLATIPSETAISVSHTALNVETAFDSCPYHKMQRDIWEATGAAVGAIPGAKAQLMLLTTTGMYLGSAVP